MAHVNISIAGRTYRMACDDGEEERLVALAGTFDSVIDDLRKMFGEVGDQRLTVMAGITIADQLESARDRIAALQKETDGLREGGADAALRLQAKDGELIDKLRSAAEQIDRLASGLNRSVRSDETA